MKARDGQDRIGQGRAKRAGSGQAIAKKQGRKLAGKRREGRDERFPESADSEMRAALWLPLLDTELLALGIHRSWRYHFPHADGR
jgi:hypothetical protein